MNWSHAKTRGCALVKSNDWFNHSLSNRLKWLVGYYWVAITGTTKTSVLESSYSYNNIRPSVCVCVQCQSFLCLIVFLCLVMNAVPDVEFKRKLFLMLPWIPCCKFPTFHLLLVTLNYSNMQQKGSDTVTSLNVFEDRYSSLQTKPDAVLLNCLLYTSPSPRDA